MPFESKNYIFYLKPKTIISLIFVFLLGIYLITENSRVVKMEHDNKDFLIMLNNLDSNAIKYINIYDDHCMSKNSPKEDNLIKRLDMNVNITSFANSLKNFVVWEPKHPLFYQGNCFVLHFNDNKELIFRVSFKKDGTDSAFMTYKYKSGQPGFTIKSKNLYYWFKERGYVKPIP